MQKQKANPKCKQNQGLSNQIKSKQNPTCATAKQIKERNSKDKPNQNRTKHIKNTYQPKLKYKAKSKATTKVTNQ